MKPKLSRGLTLQNPSKRYITSTKRSCCPCCFFLRTIPWRKIISSFTTSHKYPTLQPVLTRVLWREDIRESPDQEHLCLNAPFFSINCQSVSKRHQSPLLARLWFVLLVITVLSYCDFKMVLGKHDAKTHLLLVNKFVFFHLIENTEMEVTKNLKIDLEAS